MVGADDANLSSVKLKREIDLESPLWSTGGRIRDGGELGGEREGLYMGESGGTIYLKLTVAARGLPGPSLPNDAALEMSRCDTSGYAIAMVH